MPNKTATFTLTGESEDIDNGILAFAINTEWQPIVKDDDGNDISNPVTAQDHASNELWNFVRAHIRQYNVNQGMQQGKAAALAELEPKLENTEYELVVS